MIAEFERSGLARADLARRRHRNAGTLAYWHYKLRGELAPNRRAPTVRFVPIPVGTADLSDRGHVLEARLGNAILRFQVGTDPEYVAALLDRLGRSR